jgi:hypothetical protein
MGIIGESKTYLCLSPPFLSASLSMPCSALAMCAACHAAIALSIFPGTYHDIAHIPVSHHTCLYCSKTLKSALARDRHIILKPHCCEQHLQTISQPAKKCHKRKWKNVHLSAEGELVQKQAKTEDVPQPITGQEQGAEAAEGGSTSQEEPDENRVCKQPYVETFPINTMGTPISAETKLKPDLEAYIKSCGRLGDCKLFDTAKLLMMMVPKHKDHS